MHVALFTIALPSLLLRIPCSAKLKPITRLYPDKQGGCHGNSSARVVKAGSQYDAIMQGRYVEAQE